MNADFNECLQKAEAGDMNEQYQVGRAYEDGLVVPQSYERAIKYYDLAAQKGVFEAAINSVFAKSLTVKLKVTFYIKGYRNGRLVTDNKKFIVDMKDGVEIPSYNNDESFSVSKYFLKRVEIKRMHKGEESNLIVEKGEIKELDVSTSSMSYKYTFEIVYSSRSNLKRDPQEERILLDIDHQELEKKICFACLQLDPSLNPYKNGVGETYWPVKKNILKRDYNIDWMSPVELNNDGLIDVAHSEDACEIDQEYWWKML